MASITQQLYNKKLINMPGWIPTNVCYEVYTGSIAYGVNLDDSDLDTYGFCIPPKHLIFHHLQDKYIPGFGKQPQNFEQFQQHHIQDKDALRGKGREYDLTIYNIVKFFALCMDNNPNMLDTLFVPMECIAYINAIGQLVRDNRQIFVHKGVFHKFRGYAYSQLHKMDTKNPEGKRKEIIDKWGFDLKFAYHVLRLTDECEQLLETGEMDLRRAKEEMKSIRRGEWKKEDIIDWFSAKEKHLENLYHTSSLPHRPDVDKIKSLLLQCLEHHYGSLADCVVDEKKAERAIEEIEAVIRKYHGQA